MTFIETIQANPRVSIILFSVVVSFLITLVQHYVLDKEKVRTAKKKQKELRAQIKGEKDQAIVMELNKEMFEHSMSAAKHSFKPLLITLIPALVFFAWMKNIFVDTAIGNTSFLFPVWLWYYIGASIVVSPILRKLFKLP
jgi:uncharacterized membrane protein (DUF106 family)